MEHSQSKPLLEWTEKMYYRLELLGLFGMDSPLFAQDRFLSRKRWLYFISSAIQHSPSQHSFAHGEMRRHLARRTCRKSVEQKLQDYRWSVPLPDDRFDCVIIKCLHTEHLPCRSLLTKIGHLLLDSQCQIRSLSALLLLINQHTIQK